MSSVEVGAFGVLLAAAFVVGAATSVLLARERAAMWRHLPGLLVTAAVAGHAVSVASKRWVYVGLCAMDEEHGGGTHFYGAALGAWAAIWVYCRLRRLSFAMVTDAALPAVLLGSAIGRLGCYCAGCCGGAFVIPVQLLSSAMDLTAFAAVVAWGRARGRPPGARAAAAVIAYGTVRFALETLRDEPRLLAGLTLAQILAVATVAAAAVVLARVHAAANGSPRRGGAGEPARGPLA
ncbi:MAG: prolipoprotein diacylglyceryl transferase [Planctomycetes bacterium]|nr:prolipoprotein diacylglyceryl transferase [Planctomycetota bacterium]